MLHWLRETMAYPLLQSTHGLKAERNPPTAAPSGAQNMAIHL